MDQVDGRTCSIDTYRIYELSKKPCDAVPPFIYSETFRSGMERKELDQKSCLNPGSFSSDRFFQNDKDDIKLTISQCAKCQVENWTIEENETRMHGKNGRGGVLR